MALRGRGLDTCSQSPEKMRPKRYLPQESKQFDHDCPTLTLGLDGFFYGRRALSGKSGQQSRRRRLLPPDLVIISLPSQCLFEVAAPPVSCLGGRK
jgi:hypothetical protein